MKRFAASRSGEPEPSSGIEEAAQLARTARMLELAKSLGFNLPDAFAVHRELLADFLKRVVRIHADAESHAQDPFLARRQGGEHPRRRLAQIGLNGGVNRQDRVLVLDEVAEMRILFVSDRRLQ